ncbi:MAG: purC [Candidatus Taylorbacteria bacterium]|nr:purC [Candidatus Taylorbacteria bacterium]
MAKIPARILGLEKPLPGLELIGRGKVRNSYKIPGHDDKMLVDVTNNISIFDFVLNAQVEGKGGILTAINHFLVTQVIKDACESDFIAAGAAIDEYLPAELRGNSELQRRATVVKRVNPPDVEDIVRFILTGTGWESYQKDGTVCGHTLPAGLTDGSMLPYPIYTPSTKAEIGHDVHLTADSIAERYGTEREQLALKIARAIHKHAMKRGILMGDTKFEFSFTNGRLCLVDERGTPDSSRYFDFEAYLEARKEGKLPPSLDKQFVRNYGIEIGIKKRNPKVNEDVAWVHEQVIPNEILDKTSEIYRNIFWRLTGHSISDYQKNQMGIA